MLREKCEKRVAIAESDVELLQRKELLLGESKEEVSNIWKELCDRCPLVDTPHSSGTNRNTSSEQFVFNEKLKNNPNPTTAICVAYAPNGSSIAK